MIVCPECGELIENDGSELEIWAFGGTYEVTCSLCDTVLKVMEDGDGGQLIYPINPESSYEVVNGEKRTC